MSTITTILKMAIAPQMIAVLTRVITVATTPVGAKVGALLQAKAPQ
jgi:hypothetical protein